MCQNWPQIVCVFFCKKRKVRFVSLDTRPQIFLHKNFDRIQIRNEKNVKKQIIFMFKCSNDLMRREAWWHNSITIIYLQSKYIRELGQQHILAEIITFFCYILSF